MCAINATGINTVMAKPLVKNQRTQEAEINKTEQVKDGDKKLKAGITGLAIIGLTTVGIALAKKGKAARIAEETKKAVENAKKAVEEYHISSDNKKLNSLKDKIKNGLLEGKTPEIQQKILSNLKTLENKVETYVTNVQKNNGAVFDAKIQKLSQKGKLTLENFKSETALKKYNNLLSQINIGLLEGKTEIAKEQILSNLAELKKAAGI